MANLYGPMQYRPNPTGLTLNSAPNPNAFVAPAAQQQPLRPSAGILSFADWRAQEGNSLRDLMTQRAFGRYNNHGQDPRQQGMGPFAMQQDAYKAYTNKALIDWANGGGVGGVAGGGVRGPLALDTTASSYANFLNGRG